MQIVCNEPVARLLAMRSPRLWQEVLSPDLPGKILLVQAQLNHGISGEEKPLLDTKLLALYKTVFQKFAALFGDGTRCFLVRAPEALELIGQAAAQFGGPTAGFAYLETVLCVAPRTDGKVSIAHVDDKFPPLEFELLAGLPKARVIEWSRQADQIRCNHWATVAEGALKYYVNRHKGPTGQIELNIPGVSIVVGSVLPPGETEHCDTTLTAATLAAIMTLSGEWGKVPLTELADWCRDAELAGSRRRCNPALVLMGMPGEVLHVASNPARPKGHALAGGTAFITAHTGTKNAANTNVQCAAAELGLLLLRERLAEWLTQNGPERVLLQDENYYQALLQLPLRANKAELLTQFKTAAARQRAETILAQHPAPADGFPLRGAALYVLAELERARRAVDAIRKGEAPRLGHYLQLAQIADANTFHELTAAGSLENARPMLHAVTDDDLESLAAHADPLWRQTGAWNAGTPETDLLCDLAQTVPGVHGSRRVDGNRIIVMCTREAVVPVLERLNGGYYAPKGLPPTLAAQIWPARGAGVIEV